MDIEVYNENFDLILILDIYESLVWNDRYYEHGDFTLDIPDNTSITQFLQPYYYLGIAASEKLMIIEQQTPSSDSVDGNMVEISGRSLESILLRRIIWQQTTISGNVQNAIQRLLNEAIISPSVADRKISNFIFSASTDTNVTSKTINEKQYTGDNLYDVISEICKEVKLGFKITLNSNKQFVFQLYSGNDRTSTQLTYPAVEFSYNNDNLISTKYTMDTKDYCNVTLVAGEGEGLERKTATYGSSSGLSRRELYTDARDISSNEGSDDEIPLETYITLLQERGKEKLAEREILREIDSR